MNSTHWVSTGPTGLWNLWKSDLELGVGLEVFGGEDDDLAGEAVTGGVHGRALIALLVFSPGRFLGVLTIYFGARSFRRRDVFSKHDLLAPDVRSHLGWRDGLPVVGK